MLQRAKKEQPADEEAEENAAFEWPAEKDIEADVLGFVEAAVGRGDAVTVNTLCAELGEGTKLSLPKIPSNHCSVGFHQQKTSRSEGTVPWLWMRQDMYILQSQRGGWCVL